MIDRLKCVPDYYQYSKVYTSIQQAQSDEYASIDAKNADLQAQLYVMTATWGLRYWEECLGLITIESDSYDIRRSRVLGRSRGMGKFSADLIKNVCKSFDCGTVDVQVDTTLMEITIVFVDIRGVPSNIDDLKACLSDIIHAHLGVQYKFKYLLWDELDTKNLTWDQLDALKLNWSQFEAGGW